jgi:secreted trypsin-like serine protease
MPNSNLINKVIVHSIFSETFLNDSATISGWGFNNTKFERSNVLLSASVKITDIQTCKEKLKLPKLDDIQKICAQSRNMKDACNGDSGGL